MTVFSGGLALAIQVVATVVLARLLTPRDFGLVAMVTTFSLLLTNFGVNGITEALVQREHIDQVHANNLFWINLLGGVLLTAGFAASGALLAKFYSEPLVAPIAAGVSISIFLKQFFRDSPGAAEAGHALLRGRQERYSRARGFRSGVDCIWLGGMGLLGAGAGRCAPCR